MQYWIKSSSQPAVSSVLPFQRRLIYPIWGFYTLHRRMERGRCYLAKFHLSSHGVHLLKYFTLKRLQGTGAVVLIVQMLIDTEVFTKHYCIIYVVQWTSAIVSSFFFSYFDSKALCLTCLHSCCRNIFLGSCTQAHVVYLLLENVDKEKVISFVFSYDNRHLIPTLESYFGISVTAWNIFYTKELKNAYCFTSLHSTYSLSHSGNVRTLKVCFCT